MNKILILMLMSFTLAFPKTDVEITENVKSSFRISGDEGKDFLVTFPLNGTPDNEKEGLSIYVISKVETFVTLYNEATQIYIGKVIEPGIVYEFSPRDDSYKWFFEVSNFENAVNAGIRVKSNDPVKVYVLSTKGLSSEGYMAIPVRKWGTEYVHNSYYDYNFNENYGGGFVVLANEDNTKVKIKLKDGANNEEGFGKTKGGKKHGDSISITLNRGQVYAIQGDGTTRGVFDLSGSSISANKPIGVISYHNRTMIPSEISSTYLHHLSEMIPPINAWGKEYFSIEYNRNEEKGDYYRVIAGEDNITFDVTSYDKITKEKLAEKKGIKLNKKGDWIEFFGKEEFADDADKILNGVLHFKSDRKVMVFQYTLSHSTYSPGYWPYMTALPSLSQYTSTALYQIPIDHTEHIFGYGKVNIIAKGDSKDSTNNYKLLSSIMLDGEPLIYKEPNLLTNNIPNTDYFWTTYWNKNSRQNFGETHLLEGETLFGANINGSINPESFSWPVTSNANDLSIVDTLSPKVEVIQDGPKFIFKVTDYKYKELDSSVTENVEYGLGMNSIAKLVSGATNLDRYLITVDSAGNEIDIPKGQTMKEYYFSVQIYDRFKSASAEIEIYDKNLNKTVVEINYTQPFSINTENIEDIHTRVGLKTERDFVLSNVDDEKLIIEDIFISENSNFQMNKFETPIVLNPNEKDTFKLTFLPDKNFDGSNELLVIDSIGIKTSEDIYFYEIRGFGVNPVIEVSNFEFKKVKQKTGVSSQIGKITIENKTINWLSSVTNVNINSIKFDETAPNSNLFENLRLESGEAIVESDSLALKNYNSLELHFDLNTDLVEEPGMKFARLLIESDAGSADENGQIPVTVNNEGIEFDGNYYKDNPTALEDGGYIQVEILENTQSSVEELADSDIKILNPQPISGSKLNLEISEYHGAIFTLSDIEGNVIQSLQADNKQVSIDVSGLSNGVYFINISNGKSNKTKKFMIER